MAFFLAPSAQSANGTGSYSSTGSSFVDKTFATTGDIAITGPLTSNGIYVATIKTNGSTYYTSTDLQTWTSRTWAVGATGVLSGDCDGTRFLFVAGTQSWTSTDGTTWTAAGTLPTSMPTGAAVGTNRAGRWVAMNQTNTSTVYSTDNGATWSNGGAIGSTGNTEMGWNGLYFLAYRSGGLSRSLDGISWTNISPPGAATNFWGIAAKVIAGSGGTIVCVFTSGTSQYSTDNGTTWNSATMPYNLLWRDVGYDAVSGQFLAIEYATSNTPRYAVSSDGITWTGGTFTTGNTNFWHVYGQKLFGNLYAQTCEATSTTSGSKALTQSTTYTPTTVAATPTSTATFSSTVTTTKLVSGHNGTTLSYTLNGTSFANSTMSATFYARAYNGSYWLGLMASGATVGKSTNGYTWTNFSTITSKAWYSLAWSPTANIWCAAAGDGSIMTSPDGVTWTSRTPSIAGQFWGSMTWGNGLFVAVSRTSANFMTSPDGITWTTRNTGVISGTWCDVKWSGTAFITIDQATTTRVLRSLDGITWSQVTIPSGSYWYLAVNGSGTFVAVKDNSSSCAYSSDHGATWSNKTMVDATARRWIGGVAWNNSLFIAGVFSSTYIATSPDGITWTARTGSTSLSSNPMASAWQLVTSAGQTFTKVVDAVSTSVSSRLWSIGKKSNATNISFAATPTKGVAKEFSYLVDSAQNDRSLTTISNKLLTRMASAVSTAYSVVTANPVARLITAAAISVSSAIANKTTQIAKMTTSTSTAYRSTIVLAIIRYISASAMAVSNSTLVKNAGKALTYAASPANAIINKVTSISKSLIAPTVSNTSKAALLNKSVEVANSSTMTKIGYYTLNAVSNTVSGIAKFVLGEKAANATSTAFSNIGRQMQIALTAVVTSFASLTSVLNDILPKLSALFLTIAKSFTRKKVDTRVETTIQLQGIEHTTIRIN